ncbi:hypothetical protein MTO96_000256 [Rhipicephalus appendiculatus]
MAQLHNKDDSAGDASSSHLASSAGNAISASKSTVKKMSLASNAFISLQTRLPSLFSVPSVQGPHVDRTHTRGAHDRDPVAERSSRSVTSFYGERRQRRTATQPLGGLQLGAHRTHKQKQSAEGEQRRRGCRELDSGSSDSAWSPQRFAAATAAASVSHGP